VGAVRVSVDQQRVGLRWLFGSIGYPAGAALRAGMPTGTKKPFRCFAEGLNLVTLSSLAV
jgi:hypothetical protein